MGVGAVQKTQSCFEERKHHKQSRILLESRVRWNLRIVFGMTPQASLLGVITANRRFHAFSVYLTPSVIGEENGREQSQSQSHYLSYNISPKLDYGDRLYLSFLIPSSLPARFLLTSRFFFFYRRF
jgi:hypothetical protein